MTKLAKSIRETLDYCYQFRGARIVIKLGHKVTENARRHRIFSDINKIRQVGISPLIIHANPGMKATQWRSIEHVIQKGSMLDMQTLKGYMALGMIPIIYCEKMEGINPDKIVAKIAIELKASKLVFITSVGGVFHPRETLIRQLSLSQLKDLLSKKDAVTGVMREKLEAGIMACKGGVERVHIIPGREGSILTEFFTCEGIGTMIYAKEAYEQIRKATIEEINVVADLLVEAIPGSFFNLDILGEEVESFWVFSVDDTIHGCMKLIDHSKTEVIEISCFAVSRAYENSDAQKQLLQHALEYAALNRRKGVFLSPERNTPWLAIYPWFHQLGFTKQSLLIDAEPGYWVCEI